jgi:CRISPR type III-B/RAMP module-associated protein Cmr5
MSVFSGKALGRERAAFAWKQVKENVDLGKEYRSVLRKAPSLVKSNGLSAALAFMHSKTEERYKKVSQSIGIWLTKACLIEGGNLMEEILKLDSPHYRAATNETLMLLIWMSRFVSGLVPGG